MRVIKRMIRRLFGNIEDYSIYEETDEVYAIKDPQPWVNFRVYQRSVGVTTEASREGYDFAYFVLRLKYRKNHVRTMIFVIGRIVRIAVRSDFLEKWSK